MFSQPAGTEKILKAFLKSRGVLPPKIHNLLELLDMCKIEDNSFETLQEGCEYLGRFYIPSRYPDALPGNLPEGLPDLDDAKKAFEFSQDILGFVRKKLEKGICR